MNAAVINTGITGHGVQNDLQKSSLVSPGIDTQTTYYQFVCNAAYGSFDAMDVTPNALLVDSGATSHIVCNSDRFIYFDKSYDSTNHYVELADGTRTNGLIKGKGSAEFQVYDDHGNIASIIVNDALFIPSYDININKGACCLFSLNGGMLTTSKGVKFPITSRHNLYWFDTICKNLSGRLTDFNDHENKVTDDSVITISDGKYSSDIWH